MGYGQEITVYNRPWPEMLHRHGALTHRFSSSALLLGAVGFGSLRAYCQGLLPGLQNLYRARDLFSSGNGLLK